MRTGSARTRLLVTLLAGLAVAAIAVAIATATGLGLLYLLLETARLFRGPVLALGPVSASEQYAFSAVTLAYGVALLLLGIATRSQVIRFASAAVVLVATAKVFVWCGKCADKALPSLHKACLDRNLVLESTDGRKFK